VELSRRREKRNASVEVFFLSKALFPSLRLEQSGSEGLKAPFLCPILYFYGLIVPPHPIHLVGVRVLPEIIDVDFSYHYLLKENSMTNVEGLLFAQHTGCNVFQEP
jgi:hypothetical protein